MHSTNVSFQKENLPLGKICGTSDKTPTTKTTWRKKTKKQKKTKKTKKPRVSGKGFGGHFSQIPWFFCFFLNSFSDLVFFLFFDFSDDFPEAFFRSGFHVDSS